MSNKTTSKESWDGILVNYLKACHLEQAEEKFICVGLRISDKDMELDVEILDERYIFSLNVTNKLFLKDNGIKAPKDVIGKTLTLKKVLATNPVTKKEVDSLRISKVE